MREPFFVLITAALFIGGCSKKMDSAPVPTPVQDQPDQVAGQPTRQVPPIERNVMTFDIQPFRGALPIGFGMSRDEVHRLLGLPKSSFPIFDGRGISDHFDAFNVGYDNAGIVKHVGFGPGNFELTIQGQRIWDRNQQPDPNPVFLKLDPEPLESLGFLVFLKIGVTTTGYHDDDPSQQAITVFPKGTWDELQKDAKPADLSRYKGKR